MTTNSAPSNRLSRTMTKFRSKAKAALFAVAVAFTLGMGLVADAAPTMAPIFPIDIVRVKDNPGGSVLAFLDYVQTFINNDAVVQIEGDCYSACTLFTNVPKVCILPGARLHFHAPYVPLEDYTIRQYTSSDFILFLSNYPTPIRKWIEANGGLGIDFITLGGKELEAIIPICDGYKPAVS
jgi:hypothetical protein